MRLRTKLFVVVTGLVFLLVSAISLVYLGRSLRQYVDESYSATDIIAHQVVFATRQAVENGVVAGSIAPAQPDRDLPSEVAQTLRSNASLNALMDSVISYSPTIYDISITDSRGTVLFSTNPELTGRLMPGRPRYRDLRRRSLFKLQRIIFGKAKVYDLSLPLDRNNKVFAIVHIGMRTSFLVQAFRPSLLQTIGYAGSALLISLLAAAIVAGLALAPLEQISRRLDMLTADAADDARDQEDPLLRVSSKIERMGERMRNTEQVFSALKENMDQILSNLQDGMMLFTKDTRAVLVSSSVERFLGKSRDQMLHAPAAQIFSRSTKLGRMVRDAFEQHTSIPQAEVKTEHGRRIEIALEIIQDERESLGALLTLHDLESVQEIESELEISRRLSAIGRLTGGVGHEVKNPINAIVVHLELLRNKMGDSAAPAIRHLDVIQSEIQRLDRVVETLIDFSRPVELKVEDEDIKQIAASVVLLASADMTRQNIQLVTRFPQRAVVVKADADMLRQAILNIVLNGTQAMPDGGTMQITLSEESRWAVLRISDEGVGISREVLPRIFDLYFTTKKEGSGIGLAMCYRIVQLLSGIIDVESEPGHGTTFTLKLPLSHTNERDSRDGLNLETLLSREQA